LGGVFSGNEKVRGPTKSKFRQNRQSGKSFTRKGGLFAGRGSFWEIEEKRGERKDDGIYDVFMTKRTRNGGEKKKTQMEGERGRLEKKGKRYSNKYKEKPQ